MHASRNKEHACRRAARLWLSIKEIDFSVRHYFYVWLRKRLKPICPALYATLAVPKAEELVATPYRHGGTEQAETFFLDGMSRAIHNLAELAHPAFPVTIYYAFKQAETKDDAGTSSTGWVTFLEAASEAGFANTQPDLFDQG